MRVGASRPAGRFRRSAVRSRVGSPFRALRAFASASLQPNTPAKLLLSLEISFPVVFRSSLSFYASPKAVPGNNGPARHVARGSCEGRLMTYKGVEFQVSMSAVQDVWKWKFQIGQLSKSGKTEAKLQLLAVRRVQSQIDRELRKLAHATN
jgi:hypothetical protein